MAVVNTVVALTDSTATLVLSPDGSRLSCFLTNTGTTRVYVGSDNTVSNKAALAELRVGEEWPFHDATASLYAYSVVVPAVAGQLTVTVTNPE